MSRYHVGCAGMFALGQVWCYEDEDEAIAACGDGPPGCEVHDGALDAWIGPQSQEEIDAARARLRARRVAS